MAHLKPAPSIHNNTGSHDAAEHVVDERGLGLTGELTIPSKKAIREHSPELFLKLKGCLELIELRELGAIIRCEVHVGDELIKGHVEGLTDHTSYLPLLPLLKPALIAAKELDNRREHRGFAIELLPIKHSPEGETEALKLVCFR